MNDSKERKCNSHIENYFRIVKERLRQNTEIGKLPTKCLRVLKDINTRNTYIQERLLSEIPKKSLKKYFKQTEKIDENEISLAESKNKTEIWRKKSSRKVNKNSSFNLKSVNAFVTKNSENVVSIFNV